MLINTKLFPYINNFLLSKYCFNSLFNYPKILELNFLVIIYYKQKYKYFVFINIILFLLFFSSNIKTRFYLKTSSINFLRVNLKNQKLILKFFNNFIYVYIPQIDSFSSELKLCLKKTVLKLCFFKFPLLSELCTIFLSLEHLYLFLNNYKFQLELHLKRKKNFLLNYNLVQLLRIPLSIK